MCVCMCPAIGEEIDLAILVRFIYIRFMLFNAGHAYVLPLITGLDI